MIIKVSTVNLKLSCRIVSCHMLCRVVSFRCRVLVMKTIPLRFRFIRARSYYYNAYSILSVWLATAKLGVGATSLTIIVYRLSYFLF